MISERTASSDTCPPALPIWTSPISNPEERLGVQPGVHAGDAGDVTGRGHGRSPSSKDSAND